MRPAQLVKTLEILYKSKVPLFVHGQPGIGKSSIAQQAAAQLGLEFLDVRLVYHDPSDLKFPVVDVLEKRVHWINSLFPTDPDWKGIICLEELPQCPALMQAAAMQLTLDRKIGSYHLPAGAWIVACGNRQEDRAGANRLITPLLNRFVHVDLEISNEDWKGWALTNHVQQEVISFIDFRPALLHSFDPASGHKAFCTPRSWHFTSQVLPDLPADLLFETVKGCVGEGAAAEFCAFVKTYRDLPDVDALLARPGTFKLPTDPAVLYALVGAITHRARSGTDATLNAIATVAEGMQADFSMLLMRDCLVVQKKMAQVPAAKSWMKKHQKFLISGFANNKED